MTTILANPGLVELEALTTMGLSVKEDSERAIGYFGTGFKYAIACLLRNGHKVTILRGDAEVIEFITEQSVVRGQTFQMVKMRRAGKKPVPLNFTTQLGRNWELWMAFRELYSNCLDEGGECIIGEFPQPLPGDTQIVVEGNDFEVIARGKHEIFLDSKPHLVDTTRKLEVHNRPSKYLFYKGVRAYELKTASPLTYNFTDGLVLTEDRTIKELYSATSKLGSFMCRDCRDEMILEKFLDVSEDHFEWSVDVNYGSPSDQIIHMVQEISRSRGPGKLSPSARNLLESTRKRKMADSRVELNEVQDAAYTTCLSFLEQMGHRPEKITWQFVEETDGTGFEFSGVSTCRIGLNILDGGKAKLAAVMLLALMEHRNRNDWSANLAQTMAQESIVLAQRLLKVYL
jgi:hypothetical protein